MNILLWIALVAFSFLSVRSTADGFILVLGEELRTLCWVVAIGLQLVILRAALDVFARSRALSRLLILVVYLLCVLVSVFGSFFYFDRGLNASRRIFARNVDLGDQYLGYYQAAMLFLSDRKSTLEAEQQRYKSYLEIEDGHGDISMVGPGKGPMYRQLRSLTEPIGQHLDQYRAAIATIDSQCRTAPTDNDSSSNVSFAKVRDEVACITKELGQIPQDQAVKQRLSEVYALLKTMRYATDSTPPTFSYQFPAPPALDEFTELTQQEQIDLSFRDLRARKPRTILALGLAVTLDLLILLVAYLMHMSSYSLDEPQPRRTLDKRLPVRKGPVVQFPNSVTASRAATHSK